MDGHIEGMDGCCDDGQTKEKMVSFFEVTKRSNNQSRKVESLSFLS